MRSGSEIRQPIAPPGLWERPDMVAALADRDMGTVIRIFRRWTGLSQSRLSTLVGMPQPHISELERGVRRVAALDVFERFAAGLGIPRHLLGLADDNADDRRPYVSEVGGVNYRAKETGIDKRIAASHDSWIRTRRSLNQHRGELTQIAAQLYSGRMRLANTGMLQPPEWRFNEPVDLSLITLRLTEGPTPAINGHHQETRPLRPLESVGHPYHTYHRAMRDLDRPRLFENRVCYRLLGVASESSGMRLDIGQMCYFDMIDVGEALAHELALAAIGPRGRLVNQVDWSALPFRRMIPDPFNLAAYPLMLSISTLTMRHASSGTTFLLLRRSPAKVAIAGGMLSVMPTGVFQPSSVVSALNSLDFSLWHNMMREYSEEFLGSAEHDGDGPPIDYANTEPFRAMDQARREGKIRVHCLGVGIDALNYVSDLLTVAVFDNDIFDHLFDNLVEDNDEGSIVTSDHEHRAFSFDQATIDHLLATESFAPSGAACLHLAWQHRPSILP